MSKKARYLLIALGFTIFLVLAPLTVLYVSGVSYDFKTGHFIKTGIMGFKVDPKDASIYINGKLVKETAGNVNFLRPGEYQAQVSKDGYRDWNKRLRIEANKVTWASPVPNKLTLFLKDNAVSNIASEITDFYLDGNTVVYSTPTAVGIVLENNLNEQQVIAMPFSRGTYPLNPVRLIPSPDNKFAAIMAEGDALTGVFDLKAKKITDISSLFKGPVKVQFSENNELYVLHDGNLSKVQWKTKGTILQAAAVKSFYLQDNNLYLLRNSATSSILTLADNSSLEEQILKDDLPLFSDAGIIVNFQKQVFIVADNSFYILNNTLQKLTDNVMVWNFNPGDSSLTMVHAGQLDFYNLFDQKLNFISRSAQPIGNPVLEPAISYAFFFQGNSLKALELDTRDHQNEYVFYNAQNPQKFLIDPAIQTLYVLDDGNLKSVKIRQ